MAFSTRSSRWALAATLTLAVAACSDSSTGPTTITDPQATIRDLAAVDSAFSSDAFNALGLLVANFSAPTAPASLRGVTSALARTLPPAPGAATSRALAGGISHQDFRTLAGIPGLTLAPQAPVLPDSLLGTTFEWNPDSLRYVATSRSGAPTNGITFILYRADPVFSLPDTSQEVGSLDIVDMNPAAGAQLRFLVRGVGGAPTVLDYTLTFLPGAQGATVQANGYVSNGRPGSLERRFTFNASLDSTSLAKGTSQSVDFTYDVNVPDVAVELHLASTQDTVADSAITAIDYRFTRGAENIRLAGADTATNGGNSDEALFAVTVNGNAYATLTIVNGSATIYDRTGSAVPLNANDQQYEDEVVAALILGVLDATVRLAEVLAVPAILLGFSVSLLT
jgi:hypothetical protein